MSDRGACASFATGTGDDSIVWLIRMPRALLAVIVVASFATGAMVAVSGTIGFVGLATPHLCRRIVGAEHGRLLPVAALTGAILLVWADVAARTLAAPEDLPIGIVTALFGSLFFVALLRRR